MTSDQDIGKKESEKIELVPFLEAHELVTGEWLSEIFGVWTENPDFICSRPDGRLVGIEMTKVTENYNAAFWDRLKYGEVRINPFRTRELIHCLIERKEKARWARYMKKMDENILVLQLVDGSLDQVKGAFDGLENEFRAHGFSEVWLADYSGLETHGDIELFGLYPNQWWGLHGRAWPDRKPYG